jgi:hypothetical protein
MRTVTPRRTTRLVWLILALCAVGLLATCTLYKPLRILTPEISGLTCVSDTLCLEDPGQRDQAETLSDAALDFVADRLGPIARPPRVHFCSTKYCFARFGNPEVAALYFWGANAILINETGWQPHILRHELIHHWQAEQFGGARAALRLPRWYIEGMAYVLSEDPRPQIPNAEAQVQREAFLAWRASGNNWRRPPAAP